MHRASRETAIVVSRFLPQRNPGSKVVLDLRDGSVVPFDRPANETA